MSVRLYVVSIEPAFPPDSNSTVHGTLCDGNEGFNRAGVSARFQPYTGLEFVTVRKDGFQSSRRFRQIPTVLNQFVWENKWKVSIEPAFPPDSNIKMLFFEAFKPTGFNRAGVSARFQLYSTLSRNLSVRKFQSSRRFRQIPTRKRWLS